MLNNWKLCEHLSIVQTKQASAYSAPTGQLTYIIQHWRALKEGDRRFELLYVTDAAKVHVFVPKAVQKGIVVNRARYNGLFVIFPTVATSTLFGLQLTRPKVEWKTVIIVQAPDAMAARRFKHIVLLQTSGHLEILREYGQGHRSQMMRRRGQGLSIADAPELTETKDDKQERGFVTSSIIQTGRMPKGLVKVGSKLCDDDFLALSFLLRRRWFPHWLI
mmetsp:Transcript_18934/g.54563  ORF Transcript_18934/g.54563 Transcript_18934/m.54563 type:complete len:219 (-) Transcript_18934:765-1421(-)